MGQCLQIKQNQVLHFLHIHELTLKETVVGV